MTKTDNLKLTITVDGNPVYFNAPVFYSVKAGDKEETIVLQTEIGNTTKQRIEIQIKKVTYVEPITDDKSIDTKVGDVSSTIDESSDRS